MRGGATGSSGKCLYDRLATVEATITKPLQTQSALEGCGWSVTESYCCWASTEGLQGSGLPDVVQVSAFWPARFGPTR